MYLAERIVITKDVHRQFYELADRNARLAKQLYNAALSACARPSPAGRRMPGRRMRRKSSGNWIS